MSSLPTSVNGAALSGGGVRMFENDEVTIVEKEYPTSTDTRGSIPVYEYRIGPKTNVLVDRQTGYVLITGIWKALGQVKADVIKLIESQPAIAPVVRKIRGGVLPIQGTWLPFDIAKALAQRVAWPIRNELIPLFGPDFPSTCLPPDAPGFGHLVLSAPNAGPRGRDPEARAEAKRLARSAQNNSNVDTITQANSCLKTISAIVSPSKRDGASDNPSIPLVKETPSSPSSAAAAPSTSTGDAGQYQAQVGHSNYNWYGYQARLQPFPATLTSARRDSRVPVAPARSPHSYHPYRLTSTATTYDPRQPLLPRSLLSRREHDNHFAPSTYPPRQTLPSPNLHPRRVPPAREHTSPRTRRVTRLPSGVFLASRSSFASYTPSFPLPVASLRTTLHLSSPPSQNTDLTRVPGSR